MRRLAEFNFRLADFGFGQIFNTTWTTHTKKLSVAATNGKARYLLNSRLFICQEGKLVGSERFELSTYGLRVRCSTS